MMYGTHGQAAGVLTGSGSLFSGLAAGGLVSVFNAVAAMVLFAAMIFVLLAVINLLPRKIFRKKGFK